MSTLREFKALGGNDVNRKIVTLVVEDVNGIPRDPFTGDQVYIIGRDVLKGWGSIDGPCFVLSSGHDVPQDEWKAAYPNDVAAHLGGRYESDDE